MAKWKEDKHIKRVSYMDASDGTGVFRISYSSLHGETQPPTRHSVSIVQSGDEKQVDPPKHASQDAAAQTDSGNAEENRSAVDKALGHHEPQDCFVEEAIKILRKGKQDHAVSHTSGPQALLQNRNDCSTGASEAQGEIDIDERITVQLGKCISERSKVFQGVHKGRREEIVAVKLIKNCTEENEKEIVNLKKVSVHKNVVTYYSSGHCKYKGKKVIYIAMELCDKDTLDKRVKSECTGPKSFSTMKDEVREIAEGLRHIHRCGIMHRDLKPQNILYKDGVWKISDFGLSKRLLPGKSNTRQSMADIGTDGWRAPETSDCEANSSPSSDVFSMGLIFYYVLTNGEHPFGKHKGSRQCYIRENRNCGLEKLDTLPDPKVIEDLILLMLDHLAENRPSVVTVLNHPFFWDSERKFGFYCQIMTYFDPKNAKRTTIARNKFDSKKGKYGEKLSPLNWKDDLTLNTDEVVQFQGENTNDVIKPEVLKEKATESYKTNSVIDLISFIRNRRIHICDDKEKLNIKMSMDDIWNFFSKRFPYIFVYVYYQVEEWLQDEQCDDDFKKMLSEYFLGINEEIPALVD